MADDTNFRSYRPGDAPAREETQPTTNNRGAGNDPLAELARLIGQNDPFADLRLNPTPRPSRRGFTSDNAGVQWQPSQSDPAYGVQPPAEQSNPPPLVSQSYIEPGSSGDGFQPAYDPAIYGSAPPAAGGHGYYEGPGNIPQDEEGYDDVAEPPRRSGLKTVMVLIGLGILGAGGAFAYRTVFSAGGTAAPPPVIKADTTPSKVAPAQTGESSKLIYDRVGNASQGEKVVSREEQPVDVKDSSRTAAPRTVFPLPNSPSSPDSSSATISSTLAATAPVGPASAEPKKIRTVTIRPDQPMTLDPGSAARPSAASSAPRSGAAAATPGGNASPPANARAVAPKPGAPTASAPPPAPGNAPLSLSPSPQGSNPAPAASPPPLPRTAAVTSPPPARVASASGSSEAGAYTVQLSSQRSETEAQASFRSLQSKFPNLLSDRQPIIRRADLGEKGVYFRAMVGPFASVDEASGFCSSLKSAGGQCVVQRN
jgi:hypothetical protein